MTKRTAQELVDDALSFYREGGKPGYVPGKGCRYYFSEQQRCAIGCLLPAEIAKGIQEEAGNSLNRLLWCVKQEAQASPRLSNSSKQALLELIPTDMPTDAGICFLARLQSCHDHAAADTSDPNEKRTFLPNEKRTFLECFEAKLAEKLKDIVDINLTN